MQTTKKITIILFLLTLAVINLSAQTKPDALLLYKSGKYKEAVSVCEQELKSKPNNLDSFVVMSWALLADKQYHRTYAVTAKGRTIVNADPRLIASQAEACFYLGKNDEALKLFEDYIFYAPSGIKIPSSYYFMGEIYLRLAKYKHADIAFSVAVQLSAYNSLWWTRLGYAREQAKDYRHSLEAYNKALALNKNSVDAQQGRERVLNKF